MEVLRPQPELMLPGVEYHIGRPQKTFREVVGHREAWIPPQQEMTDELRLAEIRKELQSMIQSGHERAIGAES